MYKRIALTAITALLVLTGCGQDTPDAKPAKAAQEQAEPTAEATTEAPESTLVWEVQDPDTWTKYKFDFTTPYSDELTKATDEIFNKSGADEGDTLVHGSSLPATGGANVTGVRPAFYLVRQNLSRVVCGCNIYNG